MSQAGLINSKGGGSGNVQTLTGNSGGAVPPTGNNINVIGDNAQGINITGNAGTSTLTVAGINASATQIGVASFNASEFTVTAGAVASNPITVVGGLGITITGSPVNLGGTVTITATASVPTTFTENTGTATPALNNLNIFGATTAAGSSPITTSGAGSTVTVNAQTSQAIASTDATKIGLAAFNSAQFSVDANGFVSSTQVDLHVTPFIVSASGITNGANFTTIQAACNAANAAGGGIVVVQPGTYTENLTLFSDVHIMGLQFADAGGGVNIIGTHTPPTSGGFAFQYVSLSSATAIFNSAAAGTTHLILANAAVNVTNGYTFNLANWTGKLESFDVNAAIGTADGYINNSGGSTIAIFDSSIGSGTTNVMTISGPYFVNGIAVYCPVNFITGSSLFSDFSTYGQTITISNNTTGYLRNCTFTSGASAAITMSSSGAIELSHAVVSSSNNPAIAGAGAGTLTYTDINFLSNASFAGTLTLSTVSWQPYSRAIVSTDATKVGTCSFDSARFTVDTNGFVSLNGSGAAQTITGDSGGALSPTAGNWNILGRSGSKTSGSGSTLTVKSPPYADAGSSTTSTLNSGSFVTAAITLTLPASAGLADGDLFEYVCTTSGALIIQAVGAQKIRLGSLISSAAGTATSTNTGDSVSLRFRASDGFFYATSIIGTWLMA